MHRITLLAAASLLAACVEAGTDPEVATSIEIDSIPFPSIVAGDSLRDEDGDILTIPVQAFNSRNEPLPQAPITFIVADTGTGLTIDSEGRVYADAGLTPDTLPHGPVRIVAQVGQLQSIARTLFITSRPDSLAAVTALVDTAARSDGTTAVFQSDSMAVRLLTLLPDGATDSVGYWLVRFELTDAQSLPVDTAYARLVATGDVRTETDTTNTAGVAARRVRVNISGYPPGAESDTLLISASARYRGQPVAGSPVQFTLVIRPSP